MVQFLFKVLCCCMQLYKTVHDQGKVLGKGRWLQCVGTCIYICTLLAYCKASDFVQALGVLAAEVVGAAIASAIVGSITANVPSKKQLKA